MTGDTVTIRCWIRTDKVGSRCEESFDVPRDEWDAMSDKEKEEDAMQVAFNMGEWGYEVIE